MEYLNILSSTLLSEGKPLWHALGKAWEIVIYLFEFLIFTIDWSFVSADILGSGFSLAHILGLFMAYNLIKRITQKALSIPVELGTKFFSDGITSILYSSVNKILKLPRFSFEQMKTSFVIVKNADYEYWWNKAEIHWVRIKDWFQKRTSSVQKKESS